MSATNPGPRLVPSPDPFDDDSTTRVMLEGILGVEEEHANDMLDRPAAHDSD
jgi:hypothetical protein